MKDKKGEISERDLKIIEEIARNKKLTQREISRKAGVSLGMVNMSLKKLAKRGYVKIKGMNKRSLEYVLTPKGFTEKAKKSYRYFRNTLSSLRKIKAKIQSIILDEYVKGERKFIILGEGELADIVELSIKGLSMEDIKYKRVSSEREIKEKEVVVLATKERCRKISGVKCWISIPEKIVGVI